MSDRRAYSRFVLRPLGARLYALGPCVLIAVALTFGAARPFLVWRSVPDAELPKALFSFGLLVAVSGWLWSFARMALVIDETGIVFRNFLRTWDIPWSEIAEIGVKYVGNPGDVGDRLPFLLRTRTPPAMGVRRLDDRYVPACQCTAELWLKDIRPLLSALERHTEGRNISMTLTEEDLLP